MFKFCQEHQREDSRRRWGEGDREAARERNKRWFEANREARQEYNRKHYEANREGLLEYQRQYREANNQRSGAEILTDQCRLRPDGVKRCRKCKEVLPLEAFRIDRGRADGLQMDCRQCSGWSEHKRARPFWESIGADPSRCVYCGSGEATHGDHVMPLDANGPDVVLNLVPACGSCNSAKHAKDVREWRSSKFLVQRFSPLLAVTLEWLDHRGYELDPDASLALWEEISEAQGWVLPA